MREVRVVEARPAHATAEQAAAEEAEPMAELNAEPLELQLLDEGAECLSILPERGPGELLQLGLAGQAADRPRELPHLLDRDIYTVEWERAAERQADAQAAPAAEPLADEDAVDVELDPGERAAQPLAILSLDGRDGDSELVLVPDELAQHAPGRNELLDQVATVDALRPTDVLADEPAVNHAGPMAEQVAETLELVLLDQLSPGIGVALLDGCRKQLDELFIRRNASHDLGELARVGQPGRVEARRPAELQADEHALLATDPVADQAAALRKLEPFEDVPVGLSVLSAQGVDRRREHRLRLCQPSDRLGSLLHIVQELLLFYCGRHRVLPRNGGTNVRILVRDYHPACTPQSTRKAPSGSACLPVGFGSTGEWRSYQL